MENLIDKDFPVRDIPVYFNLSMRTQVNEIDYDKHMMMYLIEFIEAFCRIVDALSPIPYEDNIVLKLNLL